MKDALFVDVSARVGGFDLAVRQEFALSGVTAIFGRSGSGKTTLLRVIAGLETRAKGRVVMAGTVWQDAGVFVAPERRGVGFVFQDTRLFPHLSVRGNLEFALARARGLGGPGLDEVVTALELGPLMPRHPQALSGGEKQRVAIGRALLSAPRILLMDEPLAALDGDSKAEILPYLEGLRDHARVPILYVSHALPEVTRLANEIVVIEAGRVLRAGPAAEVMADPNLPTILGQRDAGSLIHARLVAQEDDGLSRLETPGGALYLPHLSAQVGALLRVRIPAQDVVISLHRPEAISALNILAVTIESITADAGSGAVVFVAIGRGKAAGAADETFGCGLGVAARAGGVCGFEIGGPGAGRIRAVGLCS